MKPTSIVRLGRSTPFLGIRTERITATRGHGSATRRSMTQNRQVLTRHGSTCSFRFPILPINLRIGRGWLTSSQGYGLTIPCGRSTRERRFCPFNRTRSVRQLESGDREYGPLYRVLFLFLHADSYMAVASCPFRGDPEMLWSTVRRVLPDGPETKFGYYFVPRP